MSKEFFAIISIVSVVIWILVSQEAVNWWKMISLLSVGTVLALGLSISLFQSLPF